MKKGFDRFVFYLQQVQDTMEQARNENDPAMWLFRNNARTTFFMLEALSRLYAGLHNKKKFDKLKKHFKLIEDGLGQIDYYNSLAEAFRTNKKISVRNKTYLKTKIAESAKQLNDRLQKEGWLTPDHTRIKKITAKLEEASWLNPEKETDAIKDFYESAIDDISRFILKTKYRFHNIEEDIHELRRKLRWLSIYPQSMQGVFQFDASSSVSSHMKKYMTPEITGSPFNKLPRPGNNTSFVILNKTYFLALSWMIAKLGELKDDGLLITGLAEAIRHNSACGENESFEKAYSLLGIKGDRLRQILDESELITKTFTREKNFTKLLVRAETPKKKILKYAAGKS